MNARAYAAVCICFLLAGKALAVPSLPTAKATDEVHMLLELWVNDRTKHVVAQVAEHQGMLLVSAQDLAASGIKTSPAEEDAQGMVDLYRLPNFNIRLADMEQQLLITVPADRLIAQVFDLDPASQTKLSHSSSGFLAQYDLTGTVDNFQDSQHTSTAGALLGGTYFTPDMNVTTNGFTQTQNGRSQVVRLDSALEHDDPDTMQRVVFGDAISGSQNWSRSVRFAGVQFATDFGLRPDLNTMPLPAFFGQTAVPANVDVFVNAARVFQTNVEPGPFEINNLPLVTGNGQATAVVRDVLGRETTLVFPFYASNALLREGLESYDFDIGSLRRDYGESSFDYGDPMATATYSQGITNKLTIETHSEVAPHVGLVGGGPVISIAPYGVIHPSVAASYSDGVADSGVGGLYALSFESQTQPLGVFSTISRIDGHYNDIASVNGSLLTGFTMQTGANLNLNDYGSITASLIDTQPRHTSTSHIATGSYTLSLGDGCNFGTTSFYDMGQKQFTIQAFLNIALGDHTLATVNEQRGQHTHQEQLGLTQPANPDGGFGYRLTSSMGDGDLNEVDGTWNHNRGTLEAAFATRDGTPAARLNASGGLVVMDKTLYATRRPDGAVALVRTGKPGTTVYQENREVAAADQNGEALITNLVPYADNHLAIDPSNYNFSTIVEDTEKTVAPARNGGIIVDFTPVPRHPMLLVLHTPEGDAPPAGALVSLTSGKQGDAPLVIGHHGQLFIPDATHIVEGTVSYGTNQCHFHAAPPPPAANGAIPRLDPICLSGEAA